MREQNVGQKESTDKTITYWGAVKENKRGRRMMRNDKKLDIKCKLCGGDLIMGACATECMNCGASVHPETGEPYMNGKKIVKVCSFGGRHI